MERQAARPLALAAGRGDLSSLREQCERSHATVRDLEDALTGAAAAGHLRAVQYLCMRLSAVVPDPTDVLPFMALELAAMHDHVDVMECLYQWYTNRNMDLHLVAAELVRCAVIAGQLSVVRFVCEAPATRGVNLAVVNDLLPVVCTSPPRDRQQECARMLQYLCQLPLKCNIKPAASNDKLLVYAARAGNLPVVRILCALPTERGVNITRNGVDAAHEAARAGHWDVVWFLVQLPCARGMDPRVWNVLLVQAAYHDVVTMKRVCELAHERGVRLDAHAPACQVAARHGYLSMVQWLVQHAHESGTRLHAIAMALPAAAQHGHVQVVRFLLSIPAATHERIVACANDMLERVFVQFLSREWMPAPFLPYLSILRMVVLECPGGDTWMDQAVGRGGAGAKRSANNMPKLVALARSSFAPSVPSIVLRHVQRRRVWRRRGPLLLLRVLCDLGRATARVAPLGRSSHLLLKAREPATTRSCDAQTL